MTLGAILPVLEFPISKYIKRLKLVLLAIPSNNSYAYSMLLLLLSTKVCEKTYRAKLRNSYLPNLTTILYKTVFL